MRAGSLVHADAVVLDHDPRAVVLDGGGEPDGERLNLAHGVLDAVLQQRLQDERRDLPVERGGVQVGRQLEASLAVSRLHEVDVAHTLAELVLE